MLLALHVKAPRTKSCSFSCYPYFRPENSLIYIDKIVTHWSPHCWYSYTANILGSFGPNKHLALLIEVRDFGRKGSRHPYGYIFYLLPIILSSLSMQMYVCKSTYGEKYVRKSSYANVRKQMYVGYEVRMSKVRTQMFVHES